MKVKNTANSALAQAMLNAVNRVHAKAKKQKKGLKAFHPMAATIQETDKLDPLLAPVKEDVAKIRDENRQEASRFRNIAAVRGEDSEIGKRFLRDAEELERRAELIASNVEESRSAWMKQYGQ